MTGTDPLYGDLAGPRVNSRTPPRSSSLLWSPPTRRPILPLSSAQVYSLRIKLARTARPRHVEPSTCGPGLP